MDVLRNISSLSLSYDASTDTYTIATKAGITGYGSQIAISNVRIVVPYGATCEISFQIYVPSEHKMIIDINNDATKGSSWNGNDNDIDRNFSNGYNPTIPANNWTTIRYSFANKSQDNIEKVGLEVWDYYGIITTDDTESITYYIRNLSVAISGGGDNGSKTI